MQSAAIAPKPGSAYTDAQRREAVAQYVVLGNQARVSDITGIPDSTLSTWRQSEWWQAMEGEVRTEKKAELDAAFSSAIDKAISHVSRHLSDGDERIFNHGGEIVRARQAVSARDAATIGAILFDKRQILRNQATSITQSAGSEKLNRLAAEFEKFSRAKQIEGVAEKDE